MALELCLPKPHPTQAEVVREAGRFNVVDCGRRWGKNVLLVDRLIPEGARGFPVAWFAPTYKMLADDWRELKNTLMPLIVEKLEVEHRICLIGGGTIEMWSLDQPDAARGRRYKRVAINEAAQIPGLQNAWERVIRPTLADFQGDAWFGSTPRGHNYFWQLYMRGQDRVGWPEWRSWKYPTSANPFILPAEIEQARGELPESTFAQEYMAEFLEGEGQVFRFIQDNLYTPNGETHEGHRLVMGIDWGQKADYTALSIGCADCLKEIALDRFNAVEYPAQRDRIKAHYGRHSPEVLAEANSMGQPNIEQLRQDGIPVVGFNTTHASKAQIVQAIRLAFEQRSWKWLDIPIATSELEAYEMKVTAQGNVTYGAPAGLHDDTVIARALMLHRAQIGGFSLA